MRYLKVCFLLLTSVIFTLSCVDQDFDEPPPDGVDPDVTATHSIAELKDLYPPSSFHEIDQDIIISGVIIADDESGNFFRSLVIQDGDEGIQLRIDATELYTEYRIGRRIFIHCEGLTIGSFAGLPQLGGGFERNNQGNIIGVIGIPEPLLAEYIEKGQWNQFVEPKVRSISDLQPEDLNTLIRFENVQFADEELDETFAIDSFTNAGVQVRVSLNQQLVSCDGEGSILVRTSGFANFASAPIPMGRGFVDGVYTVFNTDEQLFLRDLSDVAAMDEARCDVSFTIQSLRDMYSGSEITIPGGVIIEGRVISDRSTNNINNQNIVIENEEGYGIVVRFISPHNFNLGDVVQIDVSGAELGEFNGWIQINFVDNLNAMLSSENITVTPHVLTISELLSNFERYESTLVTIQDATISGGATFGGTLTVNDGTGSIDLFTRDFATFASESVPSGEVDITAIASDFNTPQLIIRSPSDVGGGGTGGDPELVDISVIRDLYPGSVTTIGQDYKISGVVISDAGSGNTHQQNLFVQDGSAGIVVRFQDPHSYDQGDEIEVVVTGQELSEFNGLLQVNNVPPANAELLSSGNSVTARVATVDEILNNVEAWESTLVQVNNATISGSSTFDGVTTVSDGTASIDMFTRADATFAGASVPSGAVTLVAVVSEFNTPQLFIRNLDDIQ